jgi:cobalt-zinc-cadmium efflux system membrane fusion protein
MKRIVWLCIACAVLAACDKTPVAVPEGPRVEGESVIFPADSAQLKALSVLVAEAATQETLRLSGRLGWDETRTVRVFAPLGGRIVKLNATPGDKVKTGDVLATLSSPDFGEAQAEASKAGADFGVAERSLARARELHHAGVISDKDLDLTEADFARAAAERNRTAARTRAYGVNAKSGGGVDQQFALRTPIAGVVVERNANPGQEVRSDAGSDIPLFVVSDPSRLWVNLDVPESLTGVIKPGMKIALSQATLGDETREALIEHVADFIDPDTRRTRARAVLDNSDRRLKAEMFVNADIAVDRGEFMRVPASAVILLGKSQYVFIEEAPGRFRRQPIAAEESDFDTMRIRSGVKAGERVVAKGALLLQQVIAMTGTK